MEKILSTRYAKALLDLAIEGAVVDEAAADLKEFTRILRENRDLKRFLTSPLIDRGAKLAPLDRLLAGATKLGGDFIRLLVQKGRISILEGIACDYERLAAEELGRATARIETARPIDDSEVEAIRRQLARLTKKEIRADVSVNRSILAGVRARVGDRVYDGSLLKKLENMRRILTE